MLIAIENTLSYLKNKHLNPLLLISALPGTEISFNLAASTRKTSYQKESLEFEVWEFGTIVSPV
jgi:hypothetical protein